MDETAEKGEFDRHTANVHSNVLIDGHVHIHECFALTQLLDMAAANFEAASRKLESTGRTCHVLLLCDTWAQYSFGHLRSLVESSSRLPHWSFKQTNEPEAICAVRDDGSRIMLVSGRQIQTSDGLEVLALFTTDRFSDGLGTAETVETVSDSGAITVLPWGFGKWHGKRGDIVTELIRGLDSCRLFLGDNSGRAIAFREPPQFRMARERGIKILAGTDPLPFRSQQCRIGRYGSYLRGILDEHSPSRSIKSLLCARHEPLLTYGRLELPLPFAINQIRMQLRKHLKTSRTVK